MRKDAQLNKDHILQVAEQLFLDDKISDIGMREIAQTAQIGIGTLYRHYASKSNLCLALVYRHLEEFLTSVPSIHPSNSRTGEEQFAIILRSYLQFRESNIALLQEVDKESHQGKQFYQSTYFTELVVLFKNAIQLIASDQSDETLTFKSEMLIAMLKSDIYEYERTAKHRSQSELVDRLIALLK